jgi:hypothetical protein
LAGTRGQIAAFTRCVQASVIAVRDAVRLAALAGLVAAGSSACFAEPPIADTPDETSGASCSAGQQGCVCYGNGTCEAGLECNAQVELCIPERCVPGDLACVCANGDCAVPYVCTQGLCMPNTGASESSVGSADSTGASSQDTGSEGTGTTTSTSEHGSSSADDTGSETSSGGDPTGEGCAAQACATCVECVDAEACAPEVVACDGVNGCATAVECLIQCGVYLDCLDPCCSGLTPEQLVVVNDLMLCKSDECIATCEGEAELDGCR